MAAISEILHGIDYTENEPMSRHTTFRIGGCADLFVRPKTPLELIKALKTDLPKIIIGNGSNMLFPDDGFRGMVIKYSDDLIECDGDFITCGAASLMPQIAAEAYRNSLGGFEFASGIPGSIGGGVRMNAGAYGSSMDSVVFETEYVEGDEIKTVNNPGHEFSYRHSIFCGEPLKIITSTKIKLHQAQKQDIKVLTDDYTNRRKTKQPLKFPSAGSVFKRPEGHFAGALIEQCGLKGFSVGGAQVSELHAGFIINTGGATADDVKRLIAHIQKTVFDTFGVSLECEICIL
ncbi:MAG: UDP-N-acetylmuramate dehydrogenase [Clostridia bacterium]|nr:UDP-N-acetylmuramate dehydrogenase [Clostridia bacterium]